MVTVTCRSNVPAAIFPNNGKACLSTRPAASFSKDGDSNSMHPEKSIFGKPLSSVYEDVGSLMTVTCRSNVSAALSSNEDRGVPEQRPASDGFSRRQWSAVRFEQ
nr:hypothetical protein Itr_chr02CG12640 [Ipomoea trifida]